MTSPRYDSVLVARSRGGDSSAQVTNGDARYLLPDCANSPCAEWLPDTVDPGAFPAFEKPGPIQPAAPV